MNIKKAILSVVDRDGLKEIVDDFELEDIDRRSTEEMRSALSRARRARPEVLMEYLYESQIKEVCETKYAVFRAKGRCRKLIQGFWRWQLGLSCGTKETPLSRGVRPTILSLGGGLN